MAGLYDLVMMLPPWYLPVGPVASVAILLAQAARIAYELRRP